MKRIISILIIGVLIASLAFSLVSCTNGDEDETKHNIIIDDNANDGEWDMDEEDYTYSDDYELGGIPLE